MSKIRLKVPQVEAKPEVVVSPIDTQRFVNEPTQVGGIELSDTDTLIPRNFKLHNSMDQWLKKESLRCPVAQKKKTYVLRAAVLAFAELPEKERDEWILKALQLGA